MIIDKVTQAKYLEKLKERYLSIIEVFEGRQATDDDCRHDIRGRGVWSAQRLEKSVIIDKLTLSLAVDDLSAILKEIKKL